MEYTLCETLNDAHFLLWREPHKVLSIKMSVCFGIERSIVFAVCSCRSATNTRNRYNSLEAHFFSSSVATAAAVTIFRAATWHSGYFSFSRRMKIYFHSNNTRGWWVRLCRTQNNRKPPALRYELLRTAETEQALTLHIELRWISVVCKRVCAARVQLTFVWCVAVFNITARAFKKKERE